MGHADDDLFDAVLRRRLDEQVDHRDHALGAFEREAPRPEVILVDELLEDLRLGELRENANELGTLERRVVTRGLHAVLKPEARFGLLDLRELDADGGAVRLAQVGDDLAQGRPLGEAAHPGRGEGLVEVRVCQSEVRELELGVRLGRIAERVDVREEVAADAVGVDELGDAALELGCRDDRVTDCLAVGHHGRGRVPVGRGGGARCDPAVAVAVPVALGGLRGGGGRGLGGHGQGSQRRRHRASVALEQLPPPVLDRLGALQPAGVQLLHVTSVDPEFVEHESLGTRL